MTADKIKKFKNESLLNFAEVESRQKMEKALAKVKSELGRSIAIKTGASLSQQPQNFSASLNPTFPKEVIAYVEKGKAPQAEEALAWVTEGSKTWQETPVEKRADLLNKLADWFLERRFELAAWMVYEVGKNWKEADGDVVEAIDFCRYYAEQMSLLSVPKLTQDILGEKSVITYLPKGVAVIISPWNFPLAILTGMTTAALVAGNTVIMKPSEQTLAIASFLARGLKEVGFPENTFYFLPGSGSEIGPVLVEDPRVAVIAFTGSEEVGLDIIERAAKKPKPGQRGVKRVIAEMGGKNALIIDDDADLDEAVQGALHSAFGFQGQKCSALSRLLVHEKIYDSFVHRFIEATRSLRMGNPANPEYQVGPVVDEKSQKRILTTIQKAKQRGVKVLFEAKDCPAEGYYVPPTIFEVTSNQDELFQNEIFGPVLCVKKFSNLEEGVADLNSVRYALTGGIYSRSPKNIEWVKQRVEVGNFYINRSITGAVVERHPFGGFKMSGVGSKAGGKDYLLQFLDPRTICENTVRRGFAGE